jgi:hypothetical protein
MSAIIINLSQDYALVATDTLAVSLSDYSPAGFFQKAREWPGLKMIVAGTGLARFADFWLDWALTNLSHVNNIDDVDRFAPVVLPEMFRDMEVQTSVYHIGVGADGIMKGYRYSSEQGFSSRPIPYGQCMKPSAGDEPDEQAPRDLIGLMKDQRRLQEQFPPRERVHIGGKIHIIDMSLDGSSQSGFIYDFGD